MSDEGNRIKELRKHLGLTQEKFALQIGLKRNSLSQIENGINALSPQNVLLICKEWHVSEEWLLYGTGDMFDENRRHRLYAWADSVLTDSPESFRYRFVDALTRLPDKWWELTEKIAIELLEEYDSARAEQILSSKKISEKTVIDSNDNAISDSTVSTYEVGTNYGAVGHGAIVINTDTD